MLSNLILSESIKTRYLTTEDVSLSIILPYNDFGKMVSIYYSIDENLPQWQSTFVTSSRFQQINVPIGKLPVGLHTVMIIVTETNTVENGNKAIPYDAVNAVMNGYISDYQPYVLVDIDVTIPQLDN